MFGGSIVVAYIYSMQNETNNNMTTEAIENFDYSALFTPEFDAKIEAECKIEAEQAEQLRYEKIVSKYSMDVKNHKSLKCCKRCQGKGEIKSYRHVANGVCFDCGGYGKK